MGWQDAVAIGVVLAAAFYLSSLGWKGLIGGKGGGCGSCGGCASGPEGQPEQVVTIGLGDASRSRTR